MLPGTRLLLECRQSPASLLESCSSIRQALQIHAQIILNGLHNQIFSQVKLISFFALSDPFGLDHSHLIFLRIDLPNLFIWNTMIRGYSSSDSPSESVSLYKSMIAKGLVSPNNYTFPFLVKSCAKLSNVRIGLPIHSHIIKHGFHSDLFVLNSLIYMYSSFGDLGLAYHLFTESNDRDLVSFNTMINGYTRSGRPVDALLLFQNMQLSGFKPDEFTFVAILSACSMLKDSKRGKQIHLFLCKNADIDDSNILLKSSLVDMYAKCGLMKAADGVFREAGTSKSTMAWSSMVSGYAKCGEIKIARHFFDQMPQRDLVSWTAMISGYSQTGHYDEALKLFAEMEGLDIVPDEVTMVAVLSACAQLGALDYGKKLHQYIEGRAFDHNVILTTAIVDMYAKCGSIEDALNVFYGVAENSRNVFLFNSIISGLAQHGLGKKAMEVCKEMGTAGLRADNITFVGLLCACSHGGLIEEGKKVFDSMVKNHGIELQMEHYGCMVDLLGRGGYLSEAYDFILKMPVEANSVIWGALLSSCRIHRNIEMGEVASKELIKLDPDHAGRYILLSNIFTDANRWEDARRIRKQMEERGIQKPSGWSCIELNGSLHQFFASDKSYRQNEEMVSMLEEMVRQLRSAGHAPDTTQVSFDIADEEKASVVSYHSERLALAFGLINSSPHTTIRIAKNLRICDDCHFSFKLLSKIFRREIVVRDRIRFHHFRCGSCSCLDYW